MAIKVIEIIGIVGALLPVPIAVGALVWAQHEKAVKALHRWVQITGFQIVSAQKRYLRTGPFFLNSTSGQFVFRIVVRDHSGTERIGWLRVGGPLIGVLSDETDIVWDP